MITALFGIVSEITEHEITLQLDAIFIALFVPNSSFYHVGEKVSIKTYMHWNQENGFSLYGFQNSSQKLFFLELLSCSGIGPRIALSLICHIPIKEACIAIKTNNLDVFTAISGIGQKKAEQIIVHMKHALKTLEPKLSLDTSFDDSHTRVLKDLENTLLALQYTKSEIYGALRAVSTEHKNLEKEQFDFVLRKTLHYLQRIVK